MIARLILVLTLLLSLPVYAKVTIWVDKPLEAMSTPELSALRAFKANCEQNGQAWEIRLLPQPKPTEVPVFLGVGPLTIGIPF